MRRRSITFIAVGLIGLASIVLWHPRNSERPNNESIIAQVAPSEPVRQQGGANIGASELPGQHNPVGDSSTNQPDGHPSAKLRDFDNAEDLFKLAFDAMGSNDPKTLVHGFEAAQLCIAAKASWEFISPFLHSEPSQDPLRTARSNAAKSLQQRCRGFLDNDSSANNSIRSTIRAKVQQNPSIYLRSAYATDLTTEQFLEAMNRGDWVLPNVAAHEILPRMVASRGLTGSNQQAMDLGIAFTLALCDIGRDCSEQSAEYQLGCAQFNRCAGGFEPFLLKELPPERRSRVAALRAEIAAAWIRRDSAYFGFPARP